MTGIIGKHYYKEGDLVEEGEVIMELRKELEEIEVSRRKTILDSSRKALDRTSQLFKNTRSVSEEEMEQTQAQHDVALAEYDLAAENLRRRQIIAPFTGRITDFYTLEAGESVQVQTPLVRLVDTRQCYFVSNIEARTAHGLKPDTPVTVEIDSGDGKISMKATVTFVSPVVDPSSGLLKVRARFDNSGDTVRPGVDGVMIWNRD